jgi:putative toxin-antitoxin system antitoxin component (TIGR02293 family)
VQVSKLAEYRDPAFLALAPARRVGLLLGLSHDASRSELALAAEVAQGLPAETIDHLIDLLGHSAVIGPLVPKTSFRRVTSKARLSRDLGDRIIGVTRVVDAVARLYHGDRDRMLNFLTGPHMMLDGRSALDLASSSVTGAMAVLELVEQVEAGFPV